MAVKVTSPQGKFRCICMHEHILMFYFLNVWKVRNFRKQKCEDHDVNVFVLLLQKCLQYYKILL